jgi:hypothetical protein
MTLCIKSNNLNLSNLSKITLNKHKNKHKNNKFDEKSKVIWYYLNYKYDEFNTKRLYILTDWVQIMHFTTKKSKLNFYIKNDDLLIRLKSIYEKIKFTKSNNPDTELINIAMSHSDSDADSNTDSDSDVNIENDNFGDTNNIITNNIDYNNLIEIIDKQNTPELDDNDWSFYPLIFKNKSEIKLIPSKKSGLSDYILDKVENKKEIERYFPTINKSNNKFKIVGKFLISITVACFGDNFNNNSFNIYIDTAEIKYDKTYVSDDILKSKGIYDDKIKIDL